VTNALHHMPGGGTISLSAEPVELSEGQSETRIRVADTGERITAENLPYIYAQNHPGHVAVCLGVER